MTDAALLRYGLPVAMDAEKLVLGVILTDPEAASVALESLAPEDFSIDKHRRILACAVAVRDRGDIVERVTVAAELKARGQLKAADGIGYLVDLDNGTPKIFGLAGYLRTLRDKAILRRAVQVAHTLIGECCAPGADVEAVVKAEEFLRTLSTERQSKRALLSLGEHLDRSGGLDQFFASQNQGLVPVPWDGLRSYVPGFRAGQLIVIAARPGMGKSAVAAQLAVHAARQNCATAVFSFEMGRDEIWRRMVAHVAAVSLGRIGRGDLNPMDRFAAQTAVQDLSEWPLYIDETTGCTVPAMVSALRRHRSSGREAGLVVVDYLQLMQTTRRRDKRVEEITEISRQLKLAARDLKVPFVVLAQLNREVEKDGSQPELHHLRESGSVEQDADIVIFLWQDRKERQRAIASRTPGEMVLIVRKNRNGSPGMCKVLFEPRLMTLSDLAEAS